VVSPCTLMLGVAVSSSGAVATERDSRLGFMKWLFSCEPIGQASHDVHLRLRSRPSLNNRLPIQTTRPRIQSVRQTSFYQLGGKADPPLVKWMSSTSISVIADVVLKISKNWLTAERSTSGAKSDMGISTTCH
jgi:hypothetical protein